MSSLVTLWKMKLRFPNRKVIKRNLSNLNNICETENEFLLRKKEKGFFKKTTCNYMETSSSVQKTNGKNKKMYVSALLLAGGMCSYQLYYQWNSKKNDADFVNDMKEISDNVFDNTDNIVLFVLNKNKPEEHKKTVLEIKDEINRLGLTHINYMYTYDNKELPDYSCYLYKGRRRMMLTDEELKSKSRIDIFKEFFKPVSENYETLNKELTEDFPTFVTYDTFQTEVVQDSMTNKILLVLFENTCFLCFLYKPFINSLNKLFNDNKIQLKIKKYNIEKNDYAPNMIISRGTPTFLFYHNGKGSKLSEYKPSEIIDKIAEITKAPNEIKEQLLEMSEHIHTRMHYFGHLTMWTTESKVIESMLLQKHITDKPEKLNEEKIYNDVLTALIEEDMLRNDLLKDSLDYTKGRIKEAEKNCYVAALMMGQELIDEENKKGKENTQSLIT